MHSPVKINIHIYIFDTIGTIDSIVKRVHRILM